MKFSFLGLILLALPVFADVESRVVEKYNGYLPGYKCGTNDKYPDYTRCEDMANPGESFLDAMKRSAAEKTKAEAYALCENDEYGQGTLARSGRVLSGRQTRLDCTEYTSFISCYADYEVSCELIYYNGSKHSEGR